ncbi:hypothetical protein [Botrimarina mediterranea]|uniref:Uncharacterized protein n=1 Tax=Botrimarina mediterranea TaxID=2528022 RepID=A0A518K877_9BACT|nr:hypothetical protein [Botrimarina mediterranea]QDV73998.1 hypothetical protein Spa11_21970 [Botrimarina mediterranea]QDV78628.1 hypothetical protein K2D_22350 [Planctomycetes bacterium K2D]
MVVHNPYRWTLCCGLLFVATVTGCSQSSPESTLASLNESNVQRLTNLYFAYQKKHDFNGPKDEQDFRQFIQGISPDKLSRIGVDSASIDTVFISDRDGQPLRVRYRVKGSMMGSQEPVVFEAEGAEGMRMVGFLNMTQREVDAAEYDQLWSGKVAGGSTRNNNS